MMERGPIQPGGLGATRSTCPYCGVGCGVLVTHGPEGVTITGVRVRGSFSAVMFGALAGADSVDGDVNVLDKDGKVLRTFKVSASYAFGGFAGGIDSVRLNYLYEKFADLTAAELSGTK